MLDIAIIGGGPAGLSAGLYAERGGANAALYEALFTGGQAVKTHRIDNYPGFADGVEGFELGMKLEQHAARFGLPVEYAGVARLSLSDDVKRIELSDGRTVETKALILAMGAKPRTLGLAREEELIGSGVSYCATCDGAFFKDRPPCPTRCTSPALQAGSMSSTAEMRSARRRSCRRPRSVRKRSSSFMIPSRRPFAAKPRSKGFPSNM